jgi:hypothetical protein
VTINPRSLSRPSSDENVSSVQASGINDADLD